MRGHLRCEKINRMKSTVVTKSKAKPAPRSAAVRAPEVGLFVEVPNTAPRLSPEELKARLAAFYAKYPESRKTVRRGQKTTVELVREARDARGRR